MEFKIFTAGKDDSSRRLDKILRLLLPSAPLSEIYSITRKGLVKVNDKKAKAETKILEGDKIQIAAFIVEKYGENQGAKAPENIENFPEKIPESASQKKIRQPDAGQGKFCQAETRQINATQQRSGEQKSETADKTKYKFPFKIIFKNQHILILEKPYGITVHGKNDSMDVHVKKYYGSLKENSSLSFKPGPLHRLDERTSGLIAFSWSLKGAIWFSENIKNHSIQKEYLAIVQGKVRKKESWKDYIVKENNNEKKNFHTVKAVSFQSSENEKISLTDITPLKTFKYKNQDLSLVSFNIHTGRTHQIRSASALHGFPLFGDSAYGAFPLEKDTAVKQELFLHAWRLTFPENTISIPQSVTCPLPENFKIFLEKCNCEISDLGL